MGGWLAGVWWRLMRWLAMTRLGACLAARYGYRLDRFVLTWSGGRLSVSWVMTGLPVVLVTTTGARSGKARSVPLVALGDGERLVAVASNWGRPCHPSWYVNMRANPDVWVLIDGRESRYRARPASEGERARYWPRLTQLYPGYERYRAATERTIPIMLLEPVDA